MSPKAAAGTELEFAQASDTGRVREHNEDFLDCVLPDSPAQARTHGWLFVLADGVGGQDRGELASRAAVTSVVAGFRAAARGEPHPALLARLIQKANATVYDLGGAATTIVACALRFDRLAVAHAGDSRCYLVRRGRAALLTRDHTVSGEQARLGILSPAEAAEAPTRHVLSRSLGSALCVHVEISEHQVLPGDLLLLCSDGLHGAVTGAEIASAARAEALEPAASNLAAIANQRDGSDNISLQLIRVRSVERVGMYRGRPYRLR